MEVNPLGSGQAPAIASRFLPPRSPNGSQAEEAEDPATPALVEDLMTLSTDEAPLRRGAALPQGEGPDPDEPGGEAESSSLLIIV